MVEADGTAVDEGLGDDGGTHIEGIAFADEEGGVFAFLDRAGGLIDTEDLRGAEGEAFDGFFIGETEPDGVACLEGQVALLPVAFHAEAEGNAGLVELGGQFVGFIYIGIISAGERVYIAEDDRHLVLFEEVGDAGCFATANDDRVDLVLDGEEYAGGHGLSLIGMDEQFF